jgi:periplasmic protein TonB
MFDTLLASGTGAGPWVRPALGAGALHFLILVGAVRGTATSAPSRRPEVRDTIRLELSRSRPEPRRGSAVPRGNAEGVPAPPRLVLPRLEPPRFEPVPSTSSPIDLLALTRVTHAGSPAGSSVGTNPTGLVLHLSEVDQPPELVHEFHPIYPEVLRQMGVTGVVQLEYLIDSTGRVDPESIHILASTNSAFSASAVAAVRDARFRPARRGGRAVAVLARQSIRFVKE